MSPAAVHPLSGIKALAFDVFGTTVDWRSAVVEELSLRAYRKLASPAALGPELAARLSHLSEEDSDGGWARFAQEWRDSYGAFTAGYDPAASPEWKSVDEHHRESLVSLLGRWGLSGLYTDAEITSLSLVWHRLPPWADVQDGLAALGSSSSTIPRGSGSGSGFGSSLGLELVTATLSNGNASLLRDLDDFGPLGFRRLLSAEDFGAYKPRPEVYLGAVRALRLGAPGELAMVAAHLGDLAAARECGLRTVYVQRPAEEAWDPESERFGEARGWVDLWISEHEDGFVALAKRLEELM